MHIDGLTSRSVSDVWLGEVGHSPPMRVVFSKIVMWNWIFGEEGRCVRALAATRPEGPAPGGS